MFVCVNKVGLILFIKVVRDKFCLGLIIFDFNRICMGWILVLDIVDMGTLWDVGFVNRVFEVGEGIIAGEGDTTGSDCCRKCYRGLRTKSAAGQ